ncbi:hypothetical protein RJ639_007952 [Escallonia herrerae]|uniref:Reverse transcriptase/retrotransposon-derived protein RNase H-like domain-containing protein n=1 Tax=Escallonia herrerae TaxID=1293975 RepID=A0AA88VVG2_9ASTE|nr:hypothetical protein RJ639_007952 [Escallonia herrerae]
MFSTETSIEDNTNSPPVLGGDIRDRRCGNQRPLSPRTNSCLQTKSASPRANFSQNHLRARPEEVNPPREDSGYPLSKAIEKAKLPPNFWMPQCNLYDGSGDPGEHVYQFPYWIKPTSTSRPKNTWKPTKNTEETVGKSKEKELEKIVREVDRELTGRVAALGRFMSKSAEKCLPFFKAIRKAKDLEWTEECQKSFEELKLYLSSPPLLTKLVTGEDLFLYLSISEVAVSTVLIWEKEGKQRPIYYISKVLQDVETRYPRIDKVALAIVISARKLRPYFQSHIVVVLTDQLLGKVLQSPDASGRLVNCPKEADYALQEVHEGPFPMAIGQRRFVIVAIDYFTKWTEAEALATITASKCKEFFLEERCLSIGLRFTSVAHPQSNRQTENMNCSILQGLKRKLDDAKGAWVDELHKVSKVLRPGAYSLETLSGEAIPRMWNAENL